MHSIYLILLKIVALIKYWPRTYGLSHNQEAKKLANVWLLHYCIR